MKEVLVPILDKQGNIASWKHTYRNIWQIENMSRNVKIKSDICIEKKDNILVLDSMERIRRHRESKKAFEHEKKLTVDTEYKLRHENQQKLIAKKSIKVQ